MANNEYRYNKNIKIIKDERIDLTGYSGVDPNNSLQGRFDGAGLRTTGYCSQGDALTRGCNVWNSMENFVNDNYSGVVSDDSELNKYLNGIYKSFLQSSEDWIYIKTGMKWNVGPSGEYDDSNSILALVAMESDYTWHGDVALVTKSEYMRANSNTNCLTASALYNTTETDACRITNYLWKSEYWWWLLSPRAGYSRRVLNASLEGYIGCPNVFTPSGSVRPSLFLKSNITLTGNGTNDENIYIISD